MSSLLIGTGGGNALRVTESMRAIIRGALEANHAQNEQGDTRLVVSSNRRALRVRLVSVRRPA